MNTSGFPHAPSFFSEDAGGGAAIYWMEVILLFPFSSFWYLAPWFRKNWPFS